MARFVYLTATTLDGFLADAEGGLDWLFAVENGDEAPDFEAFIAGVGALVMGATTYTWVLAHEDVLARPEKWRRWYGDRPCWVMTHRSLPLVPGAAVELASGHVAALHARMAAAAGERDVWVVGGGDLAGQFADRGLLDELVIDIAPVTLGAGAPLLPRRLGADRLELTGVERKGQFARLRYRMRPPASG